jgi:hypothetical protein
LLQNNKEEYDRYITEISALSNYIALNACEVNGQINNMGKNQFEIAACQRKINLRRNKLDFTSGYEACQNSVIAGPRIISGVITADVGTTSRTLIEQDENEDMHLNESVYAVTIKGQ